MKFFLQFSHEFYLKIISYEKTNIPPNHCRWPYLRFPKPEGGGGEPPRTQHNLT